MKTWLSGLIVTGFLMPAWGGDLDLPPEGTLALPAVTLESAAGVSRVRALSGEMKGRILGLDPDQITEQDVKELLSTNPAPQVIGIHGGLLPIKTAMKSFARFLMGMGYPEKSLQNPGTGSYSYGYYNRSERLAGTVAWHYERDGLRPIIVGHSQGGIQAVRVLHLLAGGFGEQVQVWNPLTGAEESRYEITDPLTGRLRPVVGLQASYATAALSGGLARALPNVWDMNRKLRKIPDSVEEFTGFQKGLDILGGDFLGYGSANEYHSVGRAKVRNVRLPSISPHSTVPYVSRLLRDEEVRAWIQRYDPEGGPEASQPPAEFGRKSAQIVWAAEVWHSIKKHWVLELQRLIRAQRTDQHDG
jgi:hypothetical protein